MMTIQYSIKPVIYQVLYLLWRFLIECVINITQKQYHFKCGKHSLQVVTTTYYISISIDENTYPYLDVVVVAVVFIVSCILSNNFCIA